MWRSSNSAVPLNLVMGRPYHHCVSYWNLKRRACLMEVVDFGVKRQPARWLCKKKPRKCPDSEFVVQLESDYYCLCWLEQWVFFFLSDRG